MPIYEYKCEKCGSVFEKMQRFSDVPVKTHEDCGGAVRRLLSAPALQFKGTGWYITDYARGGSSGNGAASKPDKSTTKSSDSITSSSSTTTPSTKTE